MSTADKIEILEAIKHLENRLDKRLLKIEKEVSELKVNMVKVLKCVDHENVDFFEKLQGNHTGNRNAKLA